MVVKTLESLVLRGVAVREGGKAVGLRLGSYETIPQAKAVPFSMRRQSLGCLRTVTGTGQRPLPGSNPVEKQAANRAGRPSRRVGVLVRRSPAKLAGRTYDPRDDRWSATVGGPAATAATRLRLIQAIPVASVADTGPAVRSTISSSSAFIQRDQLQKPPVGHELPAGRTHAAASTRGT